MICNEMDCIASDVCAVLIMAIYPLIKLAILERISPFLPQNIDSQQLNK